ncbi:hypothetical protein [Agromyces archimandritae]|uniref:ABC transporter permease n=1 Tax=Agromyces archimandritae TaxID=2781962 RepID=A0A975IPF2_9MICO|nr:hypothetical protein [Agromyces archimandritae]QTX03936.1 hypothetical protein G127AT_11550 [Agromyces archimandritae]
MSASDRTPIGRVIALAIGLAAVVGVIVLAFSWPSITADPRDLPIAVSGPAEAVDAVTANVDEAQPGVIAFTEVDDRDAAVDAIAQREVYGAVVLGTEPEVLTSGAASTVVSQLLGGVAGQLETAVNAQAQQAAAAAGAPQAPPHIDVAVTDVVPLAEADERGTGLAAAMFPLVLGGIIGGVAISLAVLGALRRVLAVVVYSAVGAIAIVSIMQLWFGVLQGDSWMNVAGIALGLAAIAAPITGLVALMGRAGLALGAVVMMLVANPISAAAFPMEFLVQPWGAVGQWFPPGAAATLVRDLSYFPAADASFPWLVLGTWALAGALCSLIGHFRTAGGAEPDREAAVAAA